MSKVMGLVPEIRPVDAAARAAARERQAQLLKPPGSLGRLEDVAAWVAGVTGRARPGVPRTRVVVAAADHGVVAEGVSAFPQEVTGQMLGAFGAGWAAITVLAEHAGADVVLVDAGVIAPPDGVAAVDVGLPTPSRNLAVEPALMEDEVRSAIRAGRALAGRAQADGVDLLIAGEMGIGNTTPAACLTAALCGLSPEAVVGRGTGVDDAGLWRKRAVIARALDLHGPHLDDPLEILRRLGGGELAVLAGLALGAGEHGLGLICDGVIATAAIAVAAELAPELKPRLLAGHRSVEPAHEHLLSRLGLRPLVELDLRLGEGSGAATALLLVNAACRLHDGMATFAEAGVAGA
ncbi:MAG TPA: nicotinate-nucleotide--dimethylbenzimidazole phosphoribosyltransferase [Baekduia sp.]|uniref:nicotinate-nucleotide--dimethylbenzimidazole phosphoribosyltransferase n=1 Tax=Baekduia sp. TaxID=2600305 RepID=UPI002D7828EE|nr:nicotinate-nucleotide--dimethylbenzimidazole phosphoribosyltransferase [Baekduia sp.]HET6505658.1 nicotinate-nucleotide--dimethylbenzimidazole phosphoribosyltransferase [Baekduia sp.]